MPDCSLHCLKQRIYCTVIFLFCNVIAENNAVLSPFWNEFNIQSIATNLRTTRFKIKSKITTATRVTTQLQLIIIIIIMRWAGHVARMGEEGGGCIGSWWGSRRERDHWGGIGADGWIILGWISRR